MSKVEINPTELFEGANDVIEEVKKFIQSMCPELELDSLDVYAKFRRDDKTRLNTTVNWDSDGNSGLRLTIDKAEKANEQELLDCAGENTCQ